MNNQAQQQINQPQNQISHLLKDQNYEFQKYFLCGILSLFEVWYVLYVKILYLSDVGYLRLHFHQLDSLVQCFFTCLLLFLVLFIGKHKSFRITSISVVLYFSTVITYTLTLYLIIDNIGDYTDNNMFLFVRCFMFMQYQNSLITLVLLVIILISENPINQLKILSYILPYCVILVFFVGKLYIFFAFLQLIYFYILLTVLNNLLAGKFDLERNQIFVGVMTTYLNLIFPFCI